MKIAEKLSMMIDLDYSNLTPKEQRQLFKLFKKVIGNPPMNEEQDLLVWNIFLGYGQSENNKLM